MLRQPVFGYAAQKEESQIFTLPCGSGMRTTHCRPLPLGGRCSSGGQLPVPFSTEGPTRGPAQVYLLCQPSVYSFLSEKASGQANFFKTALLSLPNAETCGILLCGIPEGGTSMKQLQPSETLPVGLLLALTGGLLDGYSYLNRGQVFATAETGNIVLMGNQPGPGTTGPGASLPTANPGFCPGGCWRRSFSGGDLVIPAFTGVFLCYWQSAAPSFWSPACPVVPWILWPTSSSPSQAPFR